MMPQADVIPTMYAASTTQPIVANGDSAAGTAPRADGPGNEPAPAQPSTPAATKTTAAQIVLSVLGTIAFLYFARPVVLPIFLAVWRE